MTLPFRTRLVLFSTVTFAVLLTVMGAVSYRLLGRQLNLDATADLAELTTGLHGYLKVDAGTPAIAFDNKDADQVAFVQEATRYYQIYDGDDGRLLLQSEGLEPLGLHFTPDEVRAFLNAPRTFDIQTAYGRFRFSTVRCHQRRAGATCCRSGRRSIQWTRRWLGSSMCCCGARCRASLSPSSPSGGQCVPPWLH